MIAVGGRKIGLLRHGLARMDGVRTLCSVRSRRWASETKKDAAHIMTSHL